MARRTFAHQRRLHALQLAPKRLDLVPRDTHSRQQRFPLPRTQTRGNLALRRRIDRWFLCFSIWFLCFPVWMLHLHGFLGFSLLVLRFSLLVLRFPIWMLHLHGLLAFSARFPRFPLGFPRFPSGDGLGEGDLHEAEGFSPRDAVLEESPEHDELAGDEMNGLGGLADLAVAAATVLAVDADALRALPLLRPERLPVAGLRVFVLHVLVLPDVGRRAGRGSNHVERRVPLPLRGRERVVVGVDDEFADVSDEESAGVKKSEENYPFLLRLRSSS